MVFCRQLCGEVTSLSSELTSAREEGQRNEVALEEAGRNRAELARDKASLVVQLTASERENSLLSEELAAFRWGHVESKSVNDVHTACV